MKDPFRMSVSMLHKSFAALAALGLAACSPLGALNRVEAIGKNGGVRQVAEGQLFGSDPRQRLDVYAPPSAKNAPVLVFFYGGSWSSGQRQDYKFAAQAFAQRGFVVVVPDYRLVPQVKFPAFVQDGATAIRWTRDNIELLGGDPKRITVAGHSAGGYIAMMLALDPQWLKEAGAPGAIRAGVGLAAPVDFHPFGRGRAYDGFREAADPKATQPINFASAGAPPLLLLHGDDDTTVYPRNSRNLAAALTKAGARVEIKEYPGLGHVGILLSLTKRFKGKVTALDDSVEFLTRETAAPNTAS